MTIEMDTPILPQVLAQRIVEEAAAYVEMSLDQYVALLVEKANTLYTNNSRFRGNVRANGNSGRDYLAMFMRHWLAALIRRDSPTLYQKLPSAFSNGITLQ
jgi:hypothetical protein